ncbi:MAG: DUF4422 domain-containing protein [Selenomonadaceae bacterium]|nr:DUF4422 domain-containing protein [Selenomonadaceae bacterium]
MYTPRILLCGSLKNFLNAKVEIVGKISFKGAAERGEFIVPSNAQAADNFTLKEGSFKIFLDGAEISSDELKKILDGAADYIVIENHDEYLFRFRELYALKLIDRVITAETLLTYATKNFFALNNAVQIFNLIRKLCVLDVDAFFERNDYYMFPDADHKIAGILDAEFSHFYTEIYRTLDNCRFKFFDALLLTAERTPEEFIDTLIETDSLSEKIFAFVRRGSALEKFLATHENAFEKISRFPAVNGNLMLLKKFVRSDFKIYVVTHKDAKLSALPEGYEIIHAGKILAKKIFGYPGDDTGENISRLNPYLNEITALYWLWKNTRHDFIGFVHYRRFFTADEKNFLTTDEARKILREADIIVNGCEFGYIALRDWKTMLSTRPLAEHVIDTIRKFIAARQGDYLAAYNRVTNSFGVFCYEIFITRRKIFETYCEWLFSFIIDATEEILATTDIASSDDPRIYRAISFTAEHLMTVWLIKNRLKIKTLPIIFRDDV